jgi:hypothetical protein
MVVVAFGDPSVYPPLLDRARKRSPGADELRLLDSQSVHRSEDARAREFVFDQ